MAKFLFSVYGFFRFPVDCFSLALTGQMRLQGLNSNPFVKKDK